MAGLLRRYKSPLYGNYRKYALLYGVVTGMVLFAAIVAAWLVQLPYSEPENLVVDLLMTLCIFACSYIYRQNQAGGRIYLKELLILGMGIGAVAGVVYGLMLLFYGSIIDFDFVSRCIEMRVAPIEKAIADGGSAEEMVQLKNALEVTKTYTLGDWAFIGGFRTAVMSIIITFFSAIIFKTEKNIRR